MNRLFRTALIKATLKPDPRKDFHELAPDVLLTGAQAAASTRAGEACAAARGVPLSHSARSDVAKGVAPAT